MTSPLQASQQAAGMPFIPPGPSFLDEGFAYDSSQPFVSSSADLAPGNRGYSSSRGGRGPPFL